ncbi:hypothetical protein CPC16_005507, partial [Podila verticillata]
RGDKGIMFEDEVLERNRAEEEAWLAEEMMEADEERAKADAAFAFSLIVSPGEEEFAAEEEAAQWCGERYLTDVQEQRDHRLEDPEYERGIFHDEQSCDFYGLQMEHDDDKEDEEDEYTEMHSDAFLAKDL